MAADRFDGRGFPFDACACFEIGEKEASIEKRLTSNFQ
jgi:hypothetical protein